MVDAVANVRDMNLIESFCKFTMFWGRVYVDDGLDVKFVYIQLALDNNNINRLFF